MFRYIALSWDVSQPASSAAARLLGMAWQARSAWDGVVRRPGLQVFTTGSPGPDINDAHRLPGGTGVVLGKLFRRRELDAPPARGVQLDSREAAGIADSCARSLVSDFWGRYVAFVQSPSGSTCVLRDPSGTLPCFRARHEGVDIIFSWLEDALEMLGPAKTLAVNWDALTAQLCLGVLSGRASALDGVSQVLPGEVIELPAGNSAMLWSAVDVARSCEPCNAEEAADRLRSTVRACTRAWASCYDTLLLRLSGGVDSSIVLGCLVPGSTPADVIAVNYHSPGSDSDERVYARLAATRAGRDLLEHERDAGFRVEQVLMAARMPAPVPYVGWMNAGTDARLASAYAAPAMFTGAGGDPLFYEYPRWWPAADYLHDRGFDAGFPAAAMDAARLGKLSVWRTAALALKECIRPDLAARTPPSLQGLLTHAVLQQGKEAHRFTHPALGEADDLPLGKYMQAVALMYPLGYYDPFEQARAPELVNPLLSQPLVELCLRLPTYVLTQGGRGRALARRAFTAELPAQIANRRSKGGMEEHIKAVLNANIGLVRSLLLDGELSRRGLIERSRIEELLSGRPTALAGAVSQIHALTAVEAWLTRWTR
jgi:asparagine synthase (glutamine-hydrolysing)